MAPEPLELSYELDSSSSMPEFFFLLLVSKAEEAHHQCIESYLTQYWLSVTKSHATCLCLKPFVARRSRLLDCRSD